MTTYKQYTTARGNTLEVYAENDGKTCPLFSVFLREKKAHGENITLVLKAHLYDGGRYMLPKLVEKY